MADRTQLGGEVQDEGNGKLPDVDTVDKTSRLDDRSSHHDGVRDEMPGMIGGADQVVVWPATADAQECYETMTNRTTRKRSQQWVQTKWSPPKTNGLAGQRLQQ